MAKIELPDVKDIFLEYRKMQLLYQSALKEIGTKLEILNDEFKFVHKYNPIGEVRYHSFRRPRNREIYFLIFRFFKGRTSNRDGFGHDRRAEGHLLWRNHRSAGGTGGI